MGDFRFHYTVERGQPNPSTFFGSQKAVTISVTADTAVPLGPSDQRAERADPHTIFLTPEEARQRAAVGELTGLMVFPFRGTRFGGAPLTVTRDGDDIIVKSYVYVFGNSDFKAQTRTLPLETFIKGVRLKPNQLVKVHSYAPPWYKLNVTGSTSGDEESEFYVTGESMLEIGKMSDRATWLNIGMTVVDVATCFVPVGKIAGIVARPALKGTGMLAASTMLALAEVAPTALAGMASRTGTVLVEEVATKQIAGVALNQTVRRTTLQFAEHAVEQAATKSVGTVAVAEVGMTTARVISGRTVTVAAVDAAGTTVISTVTTPTGDSELDRAIDSAFTHAFDTAADKGASIVAGQGVVKVAPEIAAGFTATQVTAFQRVLGRGFDHPDIKILEQVWNAAARPGQGATLTASNARYLFDLHRNRFWTLVAKDPEARRIFTDAGCEFSGGAPYVMHNGQRIGLTIDHIVERQTNPQLALTGSNLRIAFRRENTVVLRLLNQLDPFQ